MGIESSTGTKHYRYHFCEPRETNEARAEWQHRLFLSRCKATNRLLKSNGTKHNSAFAQPPNFTPPHLQ